MCDVLKWEEKCHEYFTRHEIVNRNQLRAKLKQIPLKEEGLTIQVIEGIFSAFNKVRRAQEKELKQLKALKENKKKSRTVVTLGDIHIPFHDPLTLQGVFTFLKELKPDEIILVGDIIDCYYLSKFDKDPSHKINLQQECDIFYNLFHPLVKSLPKTKFVFMPGNHEDRLRQNKWRQPAFYGIKGLTIQSLLRLDELNIEYHEHKYKVGDAVFTHGKHTNHQSSYSAKAEHDKYRRSGVSGHTHRMGGHWFTVDNVNITDWHENGCLCDLYPKYLDDPNWQQGFHVINFHDGVPYFHPITIKNHIFDYNGVPYGPTKTK